jgi:hypothetical protein
MAIVGARMAAAQTLQITVMAEVQQLKMHVVQHHYNFDLTFLNGIVAMSVDTDRSIKSNGPGKSWIIEYYDKAQKEMNICAVGVHRQAGFEVPEATVAAERYLFATAVEEMTVLVKESYDRLVLAFHPEVLSGGPNHVNIMLMF